MWYACAEDEAVRLGFCCKASCRMGDEAVGLGMDLTYASSSTRFSRIHNSSVRLTSLSPAFHLTFIIIAGEES